MRSWSKFQYDRIGLSSGRKTCSAARTGFAPRRNAAAAGRSTFESRITGGSFRKNCSRSGASAPRSRSVGPSSSATGFRSITSGRVLIANVWSRASVSLDSSRKVGNTWNVSASAFCSAWSAENVRSEFTINCWSWPFRSFSAANTTPVFLISCRTAVDCVSRTWRTAAPSCAKPARFPSALFRSFGAVPEIVFADSCTQLRNAFFVEGSKMRRISSSSTVGSTRKFASVPPSGRLPDDFSPGDSSTNVSPSSVF